MKQRSVRTLRVAQACKRTDGTESEVPPPRVLMGSERVSQALRETPPKIAGMLVRGAFWKIEGWAGDDVERTFVFVSDHQERRVVGYRDAVRMGTDIVLPTDPEAKSFTRLKIHFSGIEALCPACGMQCRAGAAWWSHYNAKHAKRPWWLNREDWGRMLKEPYRSPPD